MAGAATLTIVPSSRSMHSTARTSARISQRRGWPWSAGDAAVGAVSGAMRRLGVWSQAFLDGVGTATAFFASNAVLQDEQCSIVESLFVSTNDSLPIPPWSAARERRVAEPAKAPLTRDAIVEAALALLDADGLEGVSMRRVAQRLGTGPASLYQHVGGKDELLELVLDRVSAEVEIPAPGVGADGWQEPLKEPPARRGGSSVRTRTSPT